MNNEIVSPNRNSVRKLPSFNCKIPLFIVYKFTEDKQLNQSDRMENEQGIKEMTKLRKKRKTSFRWKPTFGSDGL